MNIFKCSLRSHIFPKVPSDPHFQQQYPNAPIAPYPQHLILPDSGVRESHRHRLGHQVMNLHVSDYKSEWKSTHRFIGYLCFLLYEVLIFTFSHFYQIVYFYLIHRSYSLILDTYTDYFHVLHVFSPSLGLLFLLYGG